MITLINPNLVLLERDPFTTGIVYMPIALCSLAAAIRQENIPFKLIDAFGIAPNQIHYDEKFLIRGLTPDQVALACPPESQLIVLYAINLMAHHSLIQMIKVLKQRFPKVPIAILENTQAVTAYSLRKVQHEFYQQGADFVITGEAEQRGLELIKGIRAGLEHLELAAINGIGLIDAEGIIHYSPPDKNYLELDQIPFPAYELLPLKNYWKLKYSHGPFESKKYLPLLTSRGCPYPCKFCVIPETNNLRWRSRSAQNVVDEIEYFQKTLGVNEFHIEDVDPTVNDKRTKEIANQIIDRNLKINWKICAGTKIETIRNEETLELMAKSGCSYISISPETGSPRVLKAINKPFKLDHAIKLVKKMSQLGIKSQACFVLGYPGEEDEDRELTEAMIKDMTKVGVDEIALFIITPVPGSAIYDQFSGYKDYSELNFSPSWRKDYTMLNQFRLNLYRKFLIWKLMYHPFKVLKQPFKFLFKTFETKMEMTPYRAIHTRWIQFKKRIFNSLNGLNDIPPRPHEDSIS